MSKDVIVIDGKEVHYNEESELEFSAKIESEGGLFGAAVHGGRDFANSYDLKESVKAAWRVFADASRDLEKEMGAVSGWLS